MIILCPFCGQKLRNKLHDGLTSCENCSRLFDSSPDKKILSAFWMHQNWHVDLDIIKRQCELNDEESQFVGKFIIQESYFYDELVELLHKYDYNLCVA